MVMPISPPDPGMPAPMPTGSPMGMPAMMQGPSMGGAMQVCPCCGRPMDPTMGGMPMPDNEMGEPNMQTPGGGQIDPMLLQMLMSGGMPQGGGAPPMGGGGGGY